MVLHVLANAFAHDSGHIISSLNDLGVHLIGPLGRDQLGDLTNGIDIRTLKVTLLHRSKRDAAGQAGYSGSRGLGWLKEIATQGGEPHLEVWQRPLLSD